MTGAGMAIPLDSRSAVGGATQSGILQALYTRSVTPITLRADRPRRPSFRHSTPLTPFLRPFPSFLRRQE